MKKNKILSLILCSVMVLGFGLVNVHAEDVDMPELQSSDTTVKSHIDYSDRYSAEEKQLQEDKEALVEAYDNAENNLGSTSAKNEYVNEVNNFNETYGTDINPKLAKAKAASYYITSLIQTPQISGSYCGPATAQMILAAKGVNVSQSTLAQTAYLETDYWGNTPWSGLGPCPMAFTLNHFFNFNGYAPYGTSVNASTFRSYVMSDVEWGWGVAADCWEGTAWLVGHPHYTIFHWVAIDGYSDSGNSTHYADPAHNAPSISWSPSVPAYSTISTSAFATIVDGRGIVW